MPDDKNSQLIASNHLVRNNMMIKLEKYAFDGIKLLVFGLHYEIGKIIRNSSYEIKSSKIDELKEQIKNTNIDTKNIISNAKEKISSMTDYEDLLFTIEQACVDINSKASIIQNKLNDFAKKNMELTPYKNDFEKSCKALENQIEKFSVHLTNLANKLQNSLNNEISSPDSKEPKKSISSLINEGIKNDKSY